MSVRTTYQAPTADVQRAIQEVLGCDSSFVGAVPVIDAGPEVQRLVMVSVMLLIGHPTSKHAFAWWSVPGAASTAFALVLSGDGVEDAEAAVRAWSAGLRPDRVEDDEASIEDAPSEPASSDLAPPG